jgi:hypothetical protein
MLVLFRIWGSKLRLKVSWLGSCCMLPSGLPLIFERYPVPSEKPSAPLLPQAETLSPFPCRVFGRLLAFRQLSLIRLLLCLLGFWCRIWGRNMLRQRFFLRILCSKTCLLPFKVAVACKFKVCLDKILVLGGLAAVNCVKTLVFHGKLRQISRIFWLILKCMLHTS